MIDIRIDDIIESDIRANMERHFKYAIEAENAGREWKAKEFLQMALEYEKVLKEHQAERQRKLFDWW